MSQRIEIGPLNHPDGSQRVIPVLDLNPKADNPITHRIIEPGNNTPDVDTTSIVDPALTFEFGLTTYTNIDPESRAISTFQSLLLKAINRFFPKFRF